MIPCKEFKCLKLPACKNKETIFCTLLYNYHLIKSDNKNEVYETLEELVECYHEMNENIPIIKRGPIINSMRLAIKLGLDPIT